jgi:predicted Zn-ribbon and HTH transcriptional regulator
MELTPGMRPCVLCAKPDDTGFQVCAACIANNPTRVVVERECQTCQHEWKQPAQTGRCPRCRSDAVTNVAMYVIGLKRL